MTPSEPQFETAEGSGTAVKAKDLAGNPQKKAGHNYLTVK